MSYGRPPPRIEGMVSLKVDNLTYRTTPEDLRRVFERCGEVGDIYIPRDRFSRESRGFAFVRFYDKRDAEDALDAMDGRLLDGRELRVQMARYGRPSSPYRRGRRRRSGFYPNAYNNKSRSRSRRRSRSRSRSRSRRRSYSRSRSRSHSRSRSDSKSSRGRSHSRSRSGSKSRSRSK
ncbi:SR family splicing factor SC35 isoform X1 [Lycorma delicatula]|uniref:SR family splicing factor SC35 isoform X1 n=1 Tax=Lycorma delicatula TaxID=130591 RepID=UPI003F50D99F